MPNLGSLWYTMGIRDLTDADLQKINTKLKNLGFDIVLTPKILKDLTQAAVPKGVKIELDPMIKNDAVARAVEGKVMRVAVTPLLTGFREAIVKATRDNPPQAEIGVSAERLRKLIENVLTRQGFMLNISTVNDNYSKAIQTKLNGTRYNIKIHADANEIARSVQASLMQVQSRYFGLKVSRDILYRSIDEALGQRRFNINIAVQQGQARQAVQDALMRAQVIGKEQALAYQRLQTGELKAAQAELARLKAAHMGAAEAAKAHASASVNLGGVMGSNIKIAGELGAAMASMYSIHAAKEFLSQVIEIGGELEHQKIAMNTIFGDRGKTNELFGQIKGLARTSPFGVMELSKSVKALSAYGVEYNEIYDTAKRLADISAATSVDINRLILAFGKTRSRGFLDGLEAKQFAYANIPIYEMVRKKLEELEGQAVTTADVMARMKKREISFDIVKDVLWDITDPGGKFYNMQEALAGSVKTSWKLVRDNIELMFGEIAESSVGEGLKSTAEILQGLTRNWKTVSAVVGAAAVGLGIYKVATLGLNQVVSKSTTTTYQNLIAEKQRDAQRLRSASLVRRLDAEEKALVKTSGILTKEELARAYANEKLTLSQIEQLYVTGKLNKTSIIYLFRMRLIDKEGARAILTHNRLSIAIRGVGMAMAKAGKAIGAFLMNPWTAAIAAASTLIGLWQRHNEAMQKAKEIGDNLLTKASDGVENLNKALKEIKPSKGLSNIELERGIEQMAQAIKDYSPTPILDINNALASQDGQLLTLAERYDGLRRKLEELKDAYDDIQVNKVNEALSVALGDTKENWFKDGLLKNLEDYANAMEILEKHVRDYSIEYKGEVSKIVESAAQQSEAYKKSIEHMETDGEKFRHLFINAMKYWNDFDLSMQNTILSIQESGFWQNAWESVTNFDVRGTGERINAASAELDDDIRQLKERFYGTLDNMGIDIAKVSNEQLSIALKTILNESTAPEKYKEYLATRLEAWFNVSLIDDKVTPILFEAFRNAANKSSNGAIKEAMAVWETQGYNKLSDTQKTLLESLFEKATKQSETQLISLVGDANKWLKSNPGTWQIIVDMTTRDMQAQMPEWTRTAIGSRGTFTGSGESLKYLKKWGSGGTQTAARKAAREDLQDAVDELKAYVTAADKASPEYKKAIQKKEDIQAALNFLGWYDISPKVPKNKDAFAESLKQRFKDIKDAWSEFQKWSKTEGRGAAAKRIGESGLFSTLSADEIPQTVEEYRALVEKLKNELQSAGVKGTARESLLNELLKQLFAIDKTIVDERLKIALDTVSREAERQLADWNLFDKIRKATGNENLAMSIAFGMNADVTTDYPAMIKQQLQKSVEAAESTLATAIPKEGESPYVVQGYNYDKLKELYDARSSDEGMKAWMAVPEEIRKAWEKANSDILKYFNQQEQSVVDILAKYQSLQDKIAKIDYDRNEEIRKINESKDLTPEQKAQTIQRINVEADYQKFTQSNEYLRFFNDIYGLTLDEANRIGDLIQLNLNQKLQAGLITIYEYEKEMGKVRKQLESLRNVKSNAMTFLTGGIKGLNAKRLQQAEGELANNKDYQKALADQIAAQNALNSAKESGNDEAIQAAEEQLALANQSVKTFTALRDDIIKNEESWQNVADVAGIVANIAGGVSDAFYAIKDIAASFGVDTDSGAWLDVGAVVDTLTSVTSGVSQVLGSLLQGNIGGAIGGVFKTIATPFTIWSELHDKKLSKMIERSKEAAQIMQNQYDILEKQMANFLGNAANMRIEGYEGQGGAYGKQLELMKGQLAELEKQRQLEMDKKKSDNSVVEDYNKQIEEMKISIRDFAQEAANTIYGIDLNGWAQQLGDALVDAFAKGEDAAEAFDRTVADIMRSVVKNIIATEVIAPAMEGLRDYLFGENGVFANYKTGGDFKLSAEDSVGLANELNKVKDEITASKDIWDYINDALGGLLDDTESAKGGMTAGIQSLTEDTGSLLASYFNAFRADASEQTHVLWPRLLDDVLPQMNVIAQSQLDAQRQIAENTLRNAIAAEAIQASTAKLVELNDQMSRSWRRIAERNWAYS